MGDRTASEHAPGRRQRKSAMLALALIVAVLVAALLIALL
jgi:hypothetical protein